MYQADFGGLPGIGPGKTGFRARLKRQNNTPTEQKYFEIIINNLFLFSRLSEKLQPAFFKDARIPGTESAGEQAFLYRVVLPAVLGNLLCGANQTDRGRFAGPVGHVFVDIQRIPAAVDIQLVAPYEAGFIQCVQKCRRICPVG